MVKMLVIIFGGYIFLCLPPYYLNSRYFEIKLLVLRTSNFRGGNSPRFSIRKIFLFNPELGPKCS